MKISLQLIEAFLKAATAKSITEAAGELFVTQPAMSAYIHELEEQFGEKLFRRTNRGVMLTDFGKRLYADVEPVYMRFVLNVADCVDRHISSGAPPLRLGCLHYPDYMAAMQVIASRFPNAKTEYYSGSSMRDLLLCRDLDLVFIPRYEVDDCPDIAYAALTQIKQYFAVPKEWETTQISQLAGRTLLLEPNRSRNAIADVCRDMDAVPGEIVYTNSFLLIAHQIGAGKGFTVTGGYLPGNAIDSVSFIPIAERRSAFDLCAAWRAGAVRSESSSVLAALPTIDFNAITFDISSASSKWYI